MVLYRGGPPGLGPRIRILYPPKRKAATRARMKAAIVDIEAR